MADVTTMPAMLWPLMELPSVKLPYCAVCGRTYPLNEHHVVFRSQGQLVRDGKVVEKPTLTLCGAGSNLYGLDPRGNRVMLCHGKAHHKMLHFRNNAGTLQFIEFDEPVKYEEALLVKDGWRDVIGQGKRAAAMRMAALEDMSVMRALREMGIDEEG